MCVDFQDSTPSGSRFLDLRSRVSRRGGGQRSESTCVMRWLGRLPSDLNRALERVQAAQEIQDRSWRLRARRDSVPKPWRLAVKVAVCLSGQPRKVVACADSLKENLLSGVEADFFAHLWSSSSSSGHGRPIRGIVPSVPPFVGGSCCCSTRIPHEFRRHHPHLIQGSLDAITR